MNPFNADALARVDAREAIDIARSSGADPVAFITGNSHMPPLRAFGNAELAWRADDTGDVWEAYSETFDRTLSDADVYVGCPDYDNAVYVVDLARFESADDDDTGDTLSSEWVAKRPVCGRCGQAFGWCDGATGGRHVYTPAVAS